MRIRSGTSCRLLVATAGVLLALATVVSAQDAPAILGKLGVRAGVVCVLGLPDEGGPEAVIDCARAEGVRVYFQSSSGDEVAAVRRASSEAGLLGKRVFVDRGGWGAIHLADNLADGVWVGPAARGDGGVAETEILRVLRPGAKALLGERVITKPVPEGLDAWSHLYHGPDNNPISTDQAARAPFATQFMAEPFFCAQPMQTVAAGGRMFRAVGSRSSHKAHNDTLNTLYAVSGYNGTILWTRTLHPDFMIHRNTMIATGDILYLGDDTSCKLIDAHTGEVTREIVMPDGVADGKVWKWMALEKGVLYALAGGEEVKMPSRVSQDGGHGGWNRRGWKGYEYADPKTNYGYGRTLIAFDAATGDVLWTHAEEEYVDARGICMKNGRIFYYSPEHFLACLDAATGDGVWKISDPELLKAIGPTIPVMHFTRGDASVTYLKCDGRAVYFSGPQKDDLTAVSVKVGSLLWRREGYGHARLLLRDDSIYAMATAKLGSVRLEYETGEMVEVSRKKQQAFPNRHNCTRPTGTVGGVFNRGGGGASYFDIATGRTLYFPMRPPCLDGAIVSDGIVHFGPWPCRCIALFGHIALGPDGEAEAVREEGRLETAGGGAAAIDGAAPDGDDWPAYRGGPDHGSSTEATVPGKPRLLWTRELPAGASLTAPTVAGGLVFAGGMDGVLRAVNASTGEEAWTAYTGGAIRFSPAFDGGRLYAGSCDGWVYAWEAATGRVLWRYLAAREPEWIPIYGMLASRWPVGGGVVVHDGAVYAAAGVACHDGVQVVALDASTGKALWRYDGLASRRSGNAGMGFNVLGPLFIETKGALALCVPTPGKLLRDPVAQMFDIATGAPGKGKPAPSHEVEYPYLRNIGFEGRITRVAFPGGATVVVQYGKKGSGSIGLFDSPPRQKGPPKVAPRWIQNRILPCPNDVYPSHHAFVRTANAILVLGCLAGKGEDVPAYCLAALSLEDGSVMWTQQLGARPVMWGVAVDRNGRMFVTLEDGRIQCFGE